MHDICNRRLDASWNRGVCFGRLDACVCWYADSGRETVENDRVCCHHAIRLSFDVVAMTSMMVKYWDMSSSVVFASVA